MSGRGGRIVVWPDVQKMISQSRAIAPEKNLVERSIQFIRRCDGLPCWNRTYFLVNHGNSRIDDEVVLAPQFHAKSAAFFDPMTGRFGHVASMASPDDGRKVRLQLSPGQALIVLVSRNELSGPNWTYCRTSGDAQPVIGPWTVSFVKGGPEFSAEAKIDKLESWTNFAGEAGKAFSGTAKYSTTFAKPPAAAEAYRLDLGRVADSCHVSLNGDELCTLIAPPFQIDIPADKLKGQNALEVSVSNLMANRIADMDRRGVVWKKFYNANIAAHDAANRGSDGLFSAATWTPRESGLIGPVTLTPLEKFDPMAAK
jgi:hypothetical protein